MSKDIVPFNVDEAMYVGDENDGCYYQVAEGPDGWYVTVVVDCDTASFVDTLVKDDGPCPTKEHAEETGRNTAIDWCVTNGVDFDDETEADRVARQAGGREDFHSDG